MCSPMPDIEVFPESPHWAELGATEAELKRQDERWGQQDHPDWGGRTPGVERSSYAHALVSIRSRESRARVNNELGWDLILREEVYEALSEPDDDERCEELIQVAAVALQWVAAIRRRTS